MQTPSTSTPPGRGEQTAERILDAAEALFAERGFAGATLRDVAARVGLRNPSLYNHFASKESLYEAVLERGMGPVLMALGELLGAPERDERAFVERIMKLLADHPNLARLIQYEVLPGGERLSPVLRGWIQPIFARGHEAIEASPGAGRWEAEQIPLLMLALYNVVVGYFTIAPLYRELSGVDLLADDALARQTDFFVELAALLLDHRGTTHT